MNLSNVLLTDFLSSLSLRDLIGYGFLGLLSGFVLGLAIAWVLQARGWLRRDNKWHHLALKFYFLVLPVVGGVVGLQWGVVYGAEREAYSRLDGFKPQVQALAGDILAGVREYVGSLDEGALTPETQSVQGYVALVVQGYMRAHPLMPDSGQQEVTFFQAAGVQVFDQFRKTLVTQVLTDMLTSKVSSYTGLDKDVVAQALRTPLADLLDADALLGLAKRQVAKLTRGVYLGMLIQLLLVAALVAAEIVFSRRMARARALQAHPVLA